MSCFGPAWVESKQHCVRLIKQFATEIASGYMKYKLAKFLGMYTVN